MNQHYAIQYLHLENIDYHSSVFSCLYCIHYLSTYCHTWRQILKRLLSSSPRI
ncbi:hypothetical protein F4774DRAFT_386863 [Daldinia eschscholtzii]|nr:hypothetical protein F4774DRAFT_386863 [Daldinia eschscholtzii]